VSVPARATTVVLSLVLDGHYIQHLPIVRTGRAEYRVMLGSVDPGRHTLELHEGVELIALEPRRSAAARVDTIVVDQIQGDARDYTATSLAPIVYARPDTVGAYTDLPVFMWYEVKPTARGVRYRYSVPFQGRRQSRHPLPWVSTDNNMVRVEGTTRELADRALAFTVRVGTVWISSDRGVTGHRGAALLRPGGHAFELPVP